jgi:DNA-binding XRE family transcriptional regulator
MKPRPLAQKEMMPVTRQMGPVLRQQREALKRSQEQVADVAGIKLIALHNLEKGKASSKSDTYERVARALGGLCGGGGAGADRGSSFGAKFIVEFLGISAGHGLESVAVRPATPPTHGNDES